jgi:hypothetical protein
VSRECWFCGARKGDVPFDQEHVLPRGLKDLEPNTGDWESTTGRHERGSAGTYKFDSRGPVTELTTGLICKPCNGGWMSQLEGQAQPLIRSLATGQSRTLTGPERRTLARWCIKTAYVHESVDRASRVSSPEQRKKFMDQPMDLGPHRVVLFLTQDPGRRLHRATLFRNPTEERRGFWIFSEFIQLSYLAAQVWVRSVAAYPGEDRVGVPLHKDGVSIWPPEGLLTQWPPRRRINERVALGLSGGAMALLPPEQFRAYREEVLALAREAQREPGQAKAT